jgi:hypothetical protein
LSHLNVATLMRVFKEKLPAVKLAQISRYSQQRF